MRYARYIGTLFEICSNSKGNGFNEPIKSTSNPKKCKKSQSECRITINSHESPLLTKVNLGLHFLTTLTKVNLGLQFFLTTKFF